MKFHIIAVGKLKESYLREGVAEYLKRLQRYAAVEITEVVYDFDSENITPGDYAVTFKTEGYEYLVATTDKHEVGEEVGLLFGPEDLHIMSRKGSYAV